MRIQAENITQQNYVESEQNNTRGSRVKSVAQDIFSVAAATCCYKPVKKAISKTGCKFIDSRLAETAKLCTKHNELYKEAAFQAFEDSGIWRKGVHLYSRNGLAAIAQSNIQKEAGLINKIKYAFNLVNKEMAGKALRNPLSSAYSSVTKDLLVNVDTGAAISFHEMGHAIEHNKNFITKIVGISGIAAKFLPGLILAVALFRKEKPEGEESETKLGKGLDFVKKHCVALTLASQLPLLADEGYASLKGISMAKKLLPEPHVKAMSKVFGQAFCSYLVGAAAITTAVFAVNKIRNWTAAKNKE